MDLKQIYDALMARYGPQGWWPLSSVNGVNPTKTGSLQGYHPGDYSHPRNEGERLEICIGAILTQNTSWINVEKAIAKLIEERLMDAKRLAQLPEHELANHIRPSGYFNQKAKKLKRFVSFFLSLQDKTPSREQLLGLWGIGPETADSMLLYAYQQPVFVVDAYTKRVFQHLGIVSESDGYEKIRLLFESSLERDSVICQEYHALIVEHAKQYYASKPYGLECPLYRQIQG